MKRCLSHDEGEGEKTRGKRHLATGVELRTRRKKEFIIIAIIMDAVLLLVIVVVAVEMTATETTADGQLRSAPAACCADSFIFSDGRSPRLHHRRLVM